MTIVQFKDGNYGIRRGFFKRVRWFRKWLWKWEYAYLDLSWVKDEEVWRDFDGPYLYACKGTLEKVRAAYLDLIVLREAERNKPDYGTPWGKLTPEDI